MRFPPLLAMIVVLIAAAGSGCSDQAQAKDGAPKPQVQINESAQLEKSIQDQEARIKELREQNEDLRRQLNATSAATAPATTPAPAKP